MKLCVQTDVKALLQLSISMELSSPQLLKVHGFCTSLCGLGGHTCPTAAVFWIKSSVFEVVWTTLQSLVSYREGQLHIPLQNLSMKVMLLRTDSRLVSPLDLSVNRSDNISNPSAQPNLQGDSACFQLGTRIGDKELRHLFTATLFTKMINPFFSRLFSLLCVLVLDRHGTLCPLQLLPWIHKKHLVKWDSSAYILYGRLFWKIGCCEWILLIQQC